MADPTRITAQLGADLKAVRTLTGLTQRQWHDTIDLAQARISRIERGEAVPSLVQAQAWLDAGNANDDVRRRVLALTEAAHNQTRSWGELLEQDNQLQSHAQLREGESRVIRNCQLSLVPGLLQTAEYARLVLAQTNPGGHTDPAAQLAGRLERQQVLYQEGRRFEFLIGEQALLWSPGPGVMAAQLDRLVSLSTLATIEIAVLPVRREGALAWHSFIYREPVAEDSPPYVTAEMLRGEYMATDPDDVVLYWELWERLWAASATRDEALALIRRAGEMHG